MFKVITKRCHEDRRDLAADYAVRMHSGNMSDQDRMAMEEWLAQDSGNREELQALLDIWHSVGALASRRSELTGSEKQSLWGGWAVAATLVAAIGLLFLGPFQGEQNTGQKILTSYDTGVGEQRSVLLDDGTQVTLNTNTKLLVNFEENVRKIILDRGEAFFEVAADPERPFIVNTGMRAVTVLGTKFDVRKSAFDLSVEVVEGTVAVHPEGDRVSLASSMFDVKLSDETVPQQESIYRLTSGIKADFSGSMGTENSRVQVAALQLVADGYPNWKYGLVSFNRRSLYEVVKELNRYLEKKILIEDAEIMDLKVSGVFQLNAIDAALQQMESAFPIRVDEYSDRLVMTGKGI